MDLKDSTSEGSMGSLQPSSIQIFANTSTLHGIRHVFVYGPVTIRRLLWTLAFVGSLGLLLVESSDRVAFYFSYQHVTKVDEVVANSLVFPAVTICNLNEFRFSRLTTNDLYHAGELLALLDVNLQIPNPHLADPAVLAILQEKTNFKQYKPKVFNMQEFLARDFKTVSMSRNSAFLFSGCADGGGVAGPGEHWRALQEEAAPKQLPLQ
uniref:Acid-sensing ion channel 2 n=1 Tax=Calidris pygmaea TaxID=425635 RepID=A0A8C3KH38_9CHAR